MVWESILYVCGKFEGKYYIFLYLDFLGNY